MEADRQTSLFTGGFTVPNIITATRISLVPIFAWAFLVGFDKTAFVVLFVIGSTDWIDGLVARRTGQVSELGKVLDPIADRLAIVVVLLVFLFRGTVGGPVVAAILVRDLVLSAAFVVLEKRGYPRIPVNILGKAATALIFFGLGFSIMALAFPGFFSSRINIASEMCLMVGAALYWAAGALYLAKVLSLAPSRNGV